MSTGECFRFYRGKLRPVKSLNSFFVRVDLDEIVESFSKTDKAYGLFLDRVAMREDGCTNIGTFLSRARAHAFLENYCLLGIKTGYGVRLPTSAYPKDVLRIIAARGMPVTTELEWWVKESPDLMFNSIRYINERYVDDEDFRSVSSPFFECSRYLGLDFVELTGKYRYEYKRLIDYAFWHMPRYEGIESREAIRLLLDYVKQKSAMQNKFDKYPKFLRSVHDITSLAYRKFKKEYAEEVFRERIKEEYNWEGGKYIVKYPETTDEIKLEGAEQSHCVAAYIEDVIDGKTDIVFLRLKDMPDESLITVEIRKGEIWQARGYLNRLPSDEERAALSRYARARNLKYEC